MVLCSATNNGVTALIDHQGPDYQADTAVSARYFGEVMYPVVLDAPYMVWGHYPMLGFLGADFS